MATRSITGLPDNDIDSDTVSGNGADRTPYVPEQPLGRELSADETSAELAKIWQQIQARRTPAQDEEIGAALAARFKKEQ